MRYDEYVESNYTPSMLCSEIDELRAWKDKYKKENAELKASVEKQKEINKEYVDITHQLKDFIYGLIHDCSYNKDDLQKLLEL